MIICPAFLICENVLIPYNILVSKNLWRAEEPPPLRSRMQIPSLRFSSPNVAAAVAARASSSWSNEGLAEELLAVAVEHGALDDLKLLIESGHDAVEQHADLLYIAGYNW